MIKGVFRYHKNVKGSQTTSFREIIWESGTLPHHTFILWFTWLLGQQNAGEHFLFWLRILLCLEGEERLRLVFWQPQGLQLEGGQGQRQVGKSEHRQEERTLPCSCDFQNTDTMETLDWKVSRQRHEYIYMTQTADIPSDFPKDKTRKIKQQNPFWQRCSKISR